MHKTNIESLKEMTQRLIELGYTQTSISTSSGVLQPTISRVLDGHGISYEGGKRIEAFYQKVVSELAEKAA